MSQPKSTVTIYHINNEGGEPTFTLSFKAALAQIGVRLARSYAAYSRWGHLGEFPGLDTAETAGSMEHRIRFEMDQLDQGFEIAEYELHDNLVSPSVFKRTIKPLSEFDPGYDVQAALNRVALGKDTVEEGAVFLRAHVDLQMRLFMSRATDANVLVDHLREVQGRMGGVDFVNSLSEVEPMNNRTIYSLPDIVTEKFVELAAEAFPAPAMAM